MKLKFFIFVMILTFAGVFYSCSESIPESQYSGIHSQHMSDAVSMTVSFYDNVIAQGARSNSTGIIIDNVSAKDYSISENGTIHPIVDSRTIEVKNNPEIFRLSTVSFHDGTQPGFAMVCEHPYFNGVVHFTTGASLSDTTNFEPLAAEIYTIPYSIAHKLKTQMNTRASGEDGPPGDWKPVDCLDIISNGVENISWDQGYVSNSTPYCNCSLCNGTKHSPIGCVALAVGLAMVQANHFNPSFTINKNVSLSYIESDQISSPTWIQTASDFFYEVAEGCKTSYGCYYEGSGSNIDKAQAYLSSQGYICFIDDLTVKDATLNYQLVQRSLEKGLVTLCSGHPKQNDPTGHMWIIDGIRYISPDNPEVWHQFHLLWGFAGCSSWSLFYDYETYPGPIETTELSFRFRKKILYLGDIRNK